MIHSISTKNRCFKNLTSPVQIREMLEKSASCLYIWWKVYRKDDDATHLPMFHQIEGIYVNKNVNFANLKDLIYKIIVALFGDSVKLRFRPHISHLQAICRG